MRAFSQRLGLPGWLGILAILTLITRLHSLRFEVMDWDESTFILLASAVAQGGLPYETAWDNKPPGLYLSLGLVMRLFGESLLVVRLYGAACVFLAAVGVYLSARRTASDRGAGLAACVFVAACSGGFLQHTMTEQPAVVCLVFALLLLLAGKGAAVSVFGAGVLVSLAVLARSNLAVVAVVLGLYLAAGIINPSPLQRRASALIFAAGGVVPVLGLVLLYGQRGEVDLLYGSVVTVSLGFAGAHPSPFGVSLALVTTWAVQMWHDPLTIPAITILAGLGLWARAEHPGFHRDRMLVLLVIAGVLVSIVAGGRVYGHYLLQVLPFLAILSAPAFDALTRVRLNRSARVLAGLAIVGSVLAGLVMTALLLRALPNLEARYPARQIATAIAANRAPQDRVFALHAHLVYWYLNQPPPSRLATHPSALVNTEMVAGMARLGLDRAQPFGAILASLPRYIVKERGMPWYLDGRLEAHDLTHVLSGDYDLWQVVAGVEIYRRRGTGPAPP